MTQSPSHKFGQIIGESIEYAFRSVFEVFANKNELYLDFANGNPRLARNGKKKVTWTDKNGNNHDLDYVFEKNGSNEVIGVPIAFIESAWRRYTKHSRNKAQEIQGAIKPLLDTYSIYAPFAGAIIAGVFTADSIKQLKSLGFHVLYLEFDTIVDAFRNVGVDAYFDETTPDSDFIPKIQAFENLNETDKSQIYDKIIDNNKTGFREFMDSLEKSIKRKISLIRILPLYGMNHEFSSIKDAVDFLVDLNNEQGSYPIIKYEIQIVYSNSDRIDAVFIEKQDAIKFLNNYKM